MDKPIARNVEVYDFMEVRNYLRLKYPEESKYNGREINPLVDLDCGDSVRNDSYLSFWPSCVRDSEVDDDGMFSKATIQWVKLFCEEFGVSFSDNFKEGHEANVVVFWVSW